MNMTKTIQKLTISATACVALWAMMLALVPMQPSAVTQAQSDEDFSMQTARAAKLVAPKNLNSKVESEVTLGNSNGTVKRQAGRVTARAMNGKQSYVVLNVEFKTAAAQAAFKMPDAPVLTRVDRFADVFVQSEATINKIAANPSVFAIEFAAYLDVPPPPVGKDSGLISLGVPDPIVRGGINGLTGKGTIVAIVDTGIDFRHPDFIKYVNGKPVSRLKSLWDTTMTYKPGIGSKAPFSYPNGTSIGTLFTQEQLTAELQSTTRKIPATDLNGHGTACAGIAVGNGNGDTGVKPTATATTMMKNPNIVGVAPDADIIGVRTDQGDDADGLENSWLLNAANDWLDKTAGKQPLVVSCSFGGHRGAKDGNRVAERHIDARFPLTKQGRAIVIAAGNDGTRPMHAGGTFGKKDTARLMAWNTQQGALVTVYFNTTDTDIWITPASADTRYTQPKWSQNPVTKQWEATFEASPGTGGIYVYNDSGKQMEVDSYIFGGAFLPMSATYTRLIGSPGTASNAITVGSYDWNDNFHAGGSMTFIKSVCENTMTIKKISCYSSQGPRRDGVTKPEIVAPGQWYYGSAAKSNNVAVDGWSAIDTTGNYFPMNGTSAATPYTAGIIALIFQKKPDMTLGELRNLLKNNVDKTEPFVKEYPNSANTWGYGKLNLPAVKSIMASL